jgi:hypothetical protein
VASAISKLAGDINSAVKFNLPAQSSVAAIVVPKVNTALPTSTPFIIGGPSGFQTSYRPTATVGGSVDGSADPTSTGLSVLPASTQGSTIADTVNVIAFCGTVLTCDEGIVAEYGAAADTLVVNGLTTINFCGSTLRCGANGIDQAKYTLSVVASSNVDVDVQEDVGVWVWWAIMISFCFRLMIFLCWETSLLDGDAVLVLQCPPTDGMISMFVVYISYVSNDNTSLCKNNQQHQL